MDYADNASIYNPIMSESSDKIGREVSRERPLSPHLTVYKLPLTGAMISITHRLTGVFLLAGAFIFVWWLGSIARGPEACRCIFDFLSSFIGKAFLLAWTAAFYLHFMNGIRHLFWDAGFGYSKGAVHKSGIFIIIGTIVLTAVSWAIALGM